MIPNLSSRFDPTEMEFAALEARGNNLMGLMNQLVQEGMTVSVAMEAESLFPENGILQQYYSATSKDQQRQVALEALSGNMWTLLIAAIAAWIVLIVKLSSWFMGKSSGGGGGGGFSGPTITVRYKSESHFRENAGYHSAQKTGKVLPPDSPIGQVMAGKKLDDLAHDDRALGQAVLDFTAFDYAVLRPQSLLRRQTHDLSHLLLTTHPHKQYLDYVMASQECYSKLLKDAEHLDQEEAKFQANDSTADHGERLGNSFARIEEWEKKIAAFYDAHIHRHMGRLRELGAALEQYRATINAMPPIEVGQFPFRGDVAKMEMELEKVRLDLKLDQIAMKREEFGEQFEKVVKELEAAKETMQDAVKEAATSHVMTLNRFFAKQAHTAARMASNVQRLYAAAAEFESKRRGTFVRMCRLTIAILKYGYHKNPGLMTAKDFDEAVKALEEVIKASKE